MHIVIMRKPDHIDAIIANWNRECPDYDLSPVEIIGRAGRIMAFVDRAIEAKLEEFDVTRASFDVLATLRRNGPPYRMTQRALMQSLLRTSGSMSLRIDALERQRLVDREPDADDRRSTYVALSAKGRKLLDAVVPRHLANESTLLAGLSASEKIGLASLLRKWLASLEEDVAGQRRLYLGMVVLNPRASLLKRRAVGLPDISGLLVHSVEVGSRAEEAGLRKGDLICAIHDRAVGSLVELRRALNRPSAGKTRVRIVRGLQPVELQLPG